MVVRWKLDGIVREMPLPRLTLQEATQLVAAMGGGVALAEQLHTSSAGNPYLLIELSRVAPAIHLPAWPS
jgi:hypothetical protein